MLKSLHNEVTERIFLISLCFRFILLLLLLIPYNVGIDFAGLLKHILNPLIINIRRDVEHF